MPPEKGSLPCLRNSLRRVLRLKPSFNWILSILNSLQKQKILIQLDKQKKTSVPIDSKVFFRIRSH